MHNTVLPARKERSRLYFQQTSASPKPHPSKPHPCNMPQPKKNRNCALILGNCAAETALQKLHCNIRFSAVRKSFVPKAALQPKNCTATSKAALQESGAFLPLSCGLQVPKFRHPRFGLAEVYPEQGEAPGGTS